MTNPILDEAWQKLRARVIAHSVRAFTENGRLETVVNIEVREIDPRTARIRATLSGGTIICEDLDLSSAALAHFDLSTLSCFGSAERPN